MTDSPLLPSESCFCRDISLVWLLVLTRGLLVIFRVDQRVGFQTIFPAALIEHEQKY
jgi:hypothetical protein